MNTADAVRIERLGDSALLVHVGERIDVDCNARVHAIAARLRAAALRGVIDLVPAYASLLVRFDPQAFCVVERHGENASAMAGVEDTLRTILADDAIADALHSGRVHDIPVCYGGEFGPDLAALAVDKNLSADAVITLHCAAEYRVAMLGFAPGFPYLLGLDAALHAARRATPRTRVPAGSVAIGGAQTGIYPRELPGGWQLIGRTPLTLFDLARDPAALLAPGDRVRFRAIDADEFRALAGTAA